MKIVQKATTDPRFPVFTERDAHAMRARFGSDAEAAQAIADWMDKRAEGIRLADSDPMRHGFEPEDWADALTHLEPQEIYRPLPWYGRCGQRGQPWSWTRQRSRRL